MSSPGVHIDEQERRRALRSMQHVWKDLVRQLVESCVTNEEDLQRAGFSFSYQEIEDRFGQRIFLAGQMVNALLQAGPPPRQPAPPAYRVVRIEGDLAGLDERITARLAEFPGHKVHDVSVVSDDDDTWHAFVTLSGPA